MKEEMLKSLNEIKNGYDAYYIENKYSEETTHKEQFEKLREYLKDDGMSMRALNWISHCYDCYYKDDKFYNIEGDANPFYYLETKIKEVK